MTLPKVLIERIKNTHLPSSKPRPLYVDRVEQWLHSKEIIVLKGIRRCGKTHIMFQVMQNLGTENVFYVNFEDVLFEDNLSIDTLEEIVQLRDQSKKAYFFLDEIQRIPRFERWLRTWYDQELPIKFIIGGSNISLLSNELATVLTGRNITLTVKPLSWNEAKEFTSITFEEYLRFGGFPEVLLEKNDLLKRTKLQNYIDDILTKDVLYKHKAEDYTKMRSLLLFLLQNPGTKMSATKLSKQLQMSKVTVQKYLDVVIDTFLLFEVPYFSWSMKTKYIGNRASKYYVADNGFLSAVSAKENTGALYENLVALHLHNKELLDTLFYWQNGVEIDFVMKNKAIQVTATDNVPKREQDAFIEFAKKHKEFEHILITAKDSIESIGLQTFLEEASGL